MLRSFRAAVLRDRDSAATIKDVDKSRQSFRSNRGRPFGRERFAFGEISTTNHTAIWVAVRQKFPKNFEKNAADFFGVFRPFLAPQKSQKSLLFCAR